MRARIRSRLTYANVIATACLFIVLGGPAAAGEVAQSAASTASQIKKALKLGKGADKRSKKALAAANQALQKAGPGPQGSPGVQGVPGAKGEPGANGSPDSAAQVLAKLLTVDGAGSGLDADLLDGLSATAFQARGETTACASGDVVTGITAAGDVTCATDADSGGTVTSVTAGAGLSGGTITASGTLAVDGTVQRRLSAPTCSAGQYVQSIAADGTPTCAADATAPTGAAGGDLAGTYPNPTLKGPRALHYIGASGQAQFANSWTNHDSAGDYDAAAAWWVDRVGVVHLSGIITGGAANSRAFSIPVGACKEASSPDDDIWNDMVFPVAKAVDSPGALTTVSIYSTATGANADVYPGSTGPVSLDGISYRACPSVSVAAFRGDTEGSAGRRLP